MDIVRFPLDLRFNKFYVFTQAAFVAVALLLFAFFYKKRINNNLTKIFVVMMIIALLTSCFESLFLVILPKNGVTGFPLYFCARAFLSLLQSFIGLIPVYTIIACSTKCGKQLASKFEIIAFIVWAVIGQILIMITGLSFQYSSTGDNILYMEGMSTRWSFWYCVTFIAIGIYCAIKGRKLLNLRFMAPIYFYLLIGSVIGLLYFVDPYNIFLCFGESLIVFVMYLTIQNPDLDMVADLNLAKESADRANAAKSNFLSSMSHEIRTPLNAIVGLSEDIVSQTDLPEEVKEDADDIVVASKTLLEIINNIMDINKIESGKMEVLSEPYNFVEEIKPIVKMLRGYLQEGVEINENYAEDIPFALYGDKNHLKTIIRNLLTNSVKFTSHGHINLNIKCINNFATSESILMISVEDTGEGIRSEDIEKLFTKYQKVDTKRENTIAGAGLGLAITKSLVELMNGKINVQSQFGIGSIFVVQLPQKIASTNAPVVVEEKEQEVKVNDYSNKTILVVDDNRLNLKVAERTLADFHATIEECDSGQDCINLIRSGKKYDVILLDMMMPNLTGIDTMAILNNIEGFDTPVIILTADESFDAEQKYIAQGFADYVSKPFSKEQISNKLDKLFKKESGGM